MPTNPFGLTGVAPLDLGLGSNLMEQQQTETEEQRKKRLGLLNDAKASPAVAQLFGAFSDLGGLGGRTSRPRSL
jgi:hypothetical protein